MKTPVLNHTQLSHHLAIQITNILQGQPGSNAG
ncbi:hypothetical protein SK3146_04476 [Paenibacillus konkukensis]|uniref:Uncharacterized protein n=1 Tax=Paenibacillus konkukensis TaxID=2020716 RepID=A0ABY4RSY0_9BACL|nr:hypothetical protein SK3146_04476 [Paenibacillus konkukensis]